MLIFKILANCIETQQVMIFVMDATSRFMCSFLPPMNSPVSLSKTAQHLAETDVNEFAKNYNIYLYVNQE